MKRKIGLRCILKLLSLVFGFVPFSALMAQTFDPARFIDNGRTTLDTLTGLEWLDLTETTQFSYFGVMDETRPGGLFAGYRYANVTEVSDLFEAFKLPRLDTVTSWGYDLLRENEEKWSDWSDGTFHLSSLLGETGKVNDPHDRVLGRTEAYYSRRNELVVPVYGMFIYEQRKSGEVLLTKTVIRPTTINRDYGSFLVRNTLKPGDVPEIDGSTAPLAIGLLVMIGLLRREARRRSY